MILDTYTHADSCKNAKRIYTDAVFQWDCPDCGVKNNSEFDRVPFISYGDYCHVFVCDHCDNEQSDKMYSINEISHDSVSIEISDKYNLKVFSPRVQLVEIVDND